VHAGLECGVIGDKCPGMQMISFGPRIQGAHSPDERVHVESVERFWKLLVALLEELAK
jgi:dipeptidase D